MTTVDKATLKIDCSYCPIRHRAVCARCDDDELPQLNAVKYYKSVPAGQVLALRGEPLDYVATLVSGTATLSQSIDDGRTQMVGLVLPSDFIGRPGRDSLDYDVQAATDLTLCCFHRKPFERLLIEMPHVQERLLEMALDELDAARDWMLLLGRKTAREKIASFLWIFARRSSLGDKTDTDDAIRIDLPLSREVIADYLGLTIETVSRQFSTLRKDGVIELDGKRTVLINDLETLKFEAGQSSDAVFHS